MLFGTRPILCYVRGIVVDEVRMELGSRRRMVYLIVVVVTVVVDMIRD